VILVGDTSAALAQWGSYILRQYNTTIVAVTGAIGKSSALASISAVLSTKYSVYCNAEALPGRDGFVLDVGGLTSDHEIAILELSPTHVGEMTQLLLVAPRMLAL
jgi:UDP-N-acetylmuramoyl-tripeptide--D-alanyl-D-alanine ligase